MSADPLPSAPGPGRSRSPWNLLWEVPFVLCLTGALLAGVLHTVLGLWFRHASPRPGIRFLGIEVGGLPREAFDARISSILESTFRDPVLLERGDSLSILHFGDHYRVTVDLEGLYRQAVDLEAGHELWNRARRFLECEFQPFDLPWQPVFDRAHAREAIGKALGEGDGKRLYAFPGDQGRLRIVETAASEQFDAILDQIEALIRERPLDPRRYLRAPSVLDRGVEWALDPEDPEKGFRLQRAKVRSRFPTKDRGRLFNVALALGKIHGTILNPDETFSFSVAAGPFTTEAGYLEALSVEGTSLTSGLARYLDQPLPVTTEPGAGVDQLASAVFQALLRSGGKVVRRTVHPHFWHELGYTTPGFDVRILGGGVLQVENPWPLPLRITGSMTPEEVQVQVHSLPGLEDQVEIRVGVPERVPYKTELVQDPELPRGLELVERQGLDGFRVKIFQKVLRPDGRPTRETLVGDGPIDYLPRTSRIRLGTGDRLRVPRIPVPTSLLGPASPAGSEGPDSEDEEGPGELDPAGR